MDPDYSKRDYLLPKGCKDLLDVLNLQPEKAVSQRLRPQPLTFAPIAAITGQVAYSGRSRVWGRSTSAAAIAISVPRNASYESIASCCQTASIDHGDGRHPVVVRGEVSRFVRFPRMLSWKARGEDRTMSVRVHRIGIVAVALAAATVALLLTDPWPRHYRVQVKSVGLEPSGL